MPDPAPDYLTITYRPDLDVLVGRWMRPVTLPEMQAGYDLMLEAAVEHKCQYWLLDVRRRINTDGQGAHWMMTEFLPAVGVRLGGRTYLAYLLAPLLLRDQSADAAFPTPESMADKPFMGLRFTDEREAIEWLLEGRRNRLAGVA
ncbi:hypothetical protein SAMN06265337_3516 [Hymenobacter gelipurpurascens]|uniref:SpoIIAA-like n=1 Tax=Hymenobacter gelipurpurascens TaxID=89968 RepID=A0A212UEM8_9BACT|nr:hypothetical protein [Hymenobacter gelipurpurascens]SNC76695.1 hypothetical protein SAMN06265337_3516 [Hymenobacter gelipurpurascens]